MNDVSNNQNSNAFADATDTDTSGMPGGQSLTQFDSLINQGMSYAQNSISSLRESLDGVKATHMADMLAQTDDGSLSALFSGIGSKIKTALANAGNPNLPQASAAATEKILMAIIEGAAEGLQVNFSKGATAIQAMQDIKKFFALTLLVSSDPGKDGDAITKILANSPSAVDKIFGAQGAEVKAFIERVKNDEIPPEELTTELHNLAKSIFIPADAVGGGDGGHVNKFLECCAVVALAMVMMQLIQDQKYREKLDSTMWLTLQAADKEIAHDIAKVIKDKAQLEFVQGIMSAVVSGLGAACSIGGAIKGAQLLKEGRGQQANLLGTFCQGASQLFTGMTQHMIDATFAVQKADKDAQKVIYEFDQKTLGEMENKISQDEQAAVDMINQVVQQYADLIKKIQISTLTAQGQ